MSAITLEALQAFLAGQAEANVEAAPQQSWTDDAGNVFESGHIVAAQTRQAKTRKAFDPSIDPEASAYYATLQSDHGRAQFLSLWTHYLVNGLPVTERGVRTNARAAAAAAKLEAAREAYKAAKAAATKK